MCYFFITSECIRCIIEFSILYIFLSWAFSHDVAEVANVLAYSFGEEGVDRYIMIFKREYAPSEDQLNTLRKGEEWNEEVAKKLKKERENKAREEAEYAKSRKRKENFVPNSFYKDKYQHLIGKEAALEAARKTEANSSYGCGKIINTDINTNVYSEYPNFYNLYCKQKSLNVYCMV